jgi:hypothetical protein
MNKVPLPVILKFIFTDPPRKPPRKKKTKKRRKLLAA